MKKIYNDVKTALLASNLVKHVGIFDNNLRFYEKADNLPMQFPAVFVSFSGITYEQHTAHRAYAPGYVMETGQGVMRLVIAQWKLYRKDENIFDLRTQINNIVHGMHDPKSYNTITRQAEGIDSEFRGILAWFIDYDIRFNEDVYNVQSVVEDASGLGLEVERS